MTTSNANRVLISSSFYAIQSTHHAPLSTYSNAIHLIRSLPRQRSTHARTEEEVVVGDEVRVALQRVLLQDDAQVHEGHEGEQHLNKTVQRGWWSIGQCRACGCGCGRVNVCMAWSHPSYTTAQHAPSFPRPRPSINHSQPQPQQRGRTV